MWCDIIKKKINCDEDKLDEINKITLKLKNFISMINIVKEDQNLCKLILIILIKTYKKKKTTLGLYDLGCCPFLF